MIPTLSSSNAWLREQQLTNQPCQQQQQNKKQNKMEKKSIYTQLS